MRMIRMRRRRGRAWWCTGWRTHAHTRWSGTMTVTWCWYPWYRREARCPSVPAPGRDRRTPASRSPCLHSRLWSAAHLRLRSECAWPSTATCGLQRQTLRSHRWAAECSPALAECRCRCVPRQSVCRGRGWTVGAPRTPRPICICNTG